MFAVAMSLAGGAALAQLPHLDAVVAVDVGVRTVAWNSTGSALLYTKDDSEGIGLGVYAAGQREGKVLLHVAPGDRYETQWFDGAPVVAAIVYRRLESEGGDRMAAEVHLLDAKTLREKLVFRRFYEAKVPVEIDVDPSPSLVHAIFRLRENQTQHHLVLPLSGNPLVSAPDLDRAVAEGYSGPVWSVDGTATYAKGLAPIQNTGLLFDPATGQAQLKVSVVLDKKAPILGDLPLLGKFFVARKPAPPVGAPVLEVMPANGALRPVRFRGEWESESPDDRPLALQDMPAALQFGISRGEARSLWLTAGEDRPNAGVMIAPHADRSWLAPRNRAVAYLADGALFVRAIRP